VHILNRGFYFYISESESIVPPRISIPVRDDIRVKVNTGEDAYFSCLAEGRPPPDYRYGDFFLCSQWFEVETKLFFLPKFSSCFFPFQPTYRWFRETDGILSDLLSEGIGNPSSQAGPILILRQVRSENSGTYVCRVNNSVAQELARMQLNVYGEWVSRKRLNATFTFLQFHLNFQFPALHCLLEQTRESLHS